MDSFSASLLQDNSISLRQEVLGHTDFYISLFNGSLSVYSDEKYTGIILTPNCTHTSSFNYGLFVVVA